MKKFAVTLATLALAASLSLPALAAAPVPPAADYGPGMRHAANLTAEQRAANHKAQAEFLSETLALRQKLASKHVELMTLRHQVTPDSAKIKASADELVELGAQLAKKHNEYMTKYPHAFGPPGVGDGNCDIGKRVGGGMMGYGIGMEPDDTF